MSSESMLELKKSTYLESNSARFRNATRRSSLISSKNKSGRSKSPVPRGNEKNNRIKTLPWGEDWTTTTTSLMFLGRITDLAMEIALLI